MSNKPLKITNGNRSFKKGIVVTSLQQLIDVKVPTLFESNDNVDNKQSIRIVLDEDGTEVDDEDYFQTLEPNTCLMVLNENEKWSHFSTPVTISFDQVDDASSNPNTGYLLRKLKSDARSISLMSDLELEALKDLDSNKAENFEDKLFLEQVKEACTRFLMDRRDTKDALDLIKLFYDNDGFERSKK